ncbi:MAG TPA: hypothetical protein VJU85_09650 [Nitrososphaeraceae archaeon]|nr:hypothetical protein [Nitrososphaeraceae archaeon]
MLIRLLLNLESIFYWIVNGKGKKKKKKRAERNILGKSVSQTNGHDWVHNYATLVKDSVVVSTYRQKLSGKYHQDETKIQVDGNEVR